MPLTNHYPVTFQLRNQAGTPLIENENLYIEVLQLDPDGNLADSLAVDLGVSPPVPVSEDIVAERVAMTDLRASEQADVVFTSGSVENIGRGYIDPTTLEAQRHVSEDGLAVANVGGELQSTIAYAAIESVGVAVTVVGGSALTEDTNYTVNYDGAGTTITFTSGVTVADTVDVVYRTAVTEDWLLHSSESQTVGDSTPTLTIDLDNVAQIEAWAVSIINVTQSNALLVGPGRGETTGTDFDVDKNGGVGGTTRITFKNGSAVDTDVVQVTYRSLDPDTDFWVDYTTGVVTPIDATLTTGTVTVTYIYEFVWQLGLYAYALDVSGLPDGRYLIDVRYNYGGIIRTGNEQVNVRNGQVIEDLVGDSTQGAGVRRVRFLTRDDQDPAGIVGDVRISVFDSNGDSIIQQITTDTANGEARIGLPAGTFQVYAYKALVSFTNPTEIIVQAATEEQDFTVVGTLLASVDTATTSPDCCLVFGNVSMLNCDPAANMTVRAYLRKPPSVVGSSAILAQPPVCVSTDSEGNFSIPLVRGSEVVFDIQGTKYESARVVPDASSVFFNDMVTP